MNNVKCRINTINAESFLFLENRSVLEKEYKINNHVLITRNFRTLPSIIFYLEFVKDISKY
ncbi:hypothetical protein [uncultured Chryseobacterium sp.]|uniref:hypothetical protein n=1 Tax=uncultured Chryseobacterium sp. TaxID=259322 RepID=UPI0025EF2494|nr:hypothetical protein [uncultured Chryseobacterium sp.]